VLFGVGDLLPDPRGGSTPLAGMRRQDAFASFMYPMAAPVSVWGRVAAG